MTPRGARGHVEGAPAHDLIRVVTFNVKCGPSEDGPDHWDMRREILLEALRELAPHVLAVQECYPFQGDEIKMGFPSLDRVGVGRYHAIPAPERPEESRSGEHCDIFYDSDRFRCESCGVFWHSDTPEVAASKTWGNDLPRITTWAVLRSRATDRSVVFFNTHYHWDEPYRARATELHVARVRQVAGKLPFMLVGDFNLPPKCETHERLTDPGPNGLGLRDVWQLLGKPEENAGTCHDFSGVPKERIDWILASPELVPVSVEKSVFQRKERYPSDHFPIVAELGLGGEGGARRRPRTGPSVRTQDGAR